MLGLKGKDLLQHFCLVYYGKVDSMWGLIRGSHFSLLIILLTFTHLKLLTSKWLAPIINERGTFYYTSVETLGYLSQDICLPKIAMIMGHIQFYATYML